MLSDTPLLAKKLRGFDLATLDRDLLNAAARHQRFHREAAGILQGAPGCENTAARVAAANVDARALAEAERLVAALRLFLVDEGRARPPAVVPRLRIVPKPAPRPGILARTMAMLGRQPEAPSRPSEKDAA